MMPSALPIFRGESKLQENLNLCNFQNFPQTLLFFLMFKLKPSYLHGVGCGTHEEPIVDVDCA